MSDKHDFGNIGKRLPYTMPPETYDAMEANVFAALRQDRRRKPSRRIIQWCAIAGTAAAAIVALLLTVPPAEDDLLIQIDRAFANLSEADQEFLVEIGQEDIFLTQ